ncbi:MAG: restriction endonuclease subunit S, partial [Neisseriaceae bacterium]|nr:restriction endonuclease subunit S [Neisseriaceae bacterium]
QTGTNTVVLFLRKFSQNPSIYESLKARSEHIFQGNLNAVYQDEDDLKKYCEFMDYSLAEYKNFLSGSLKEDSPLFNNETFNEYIQKVKKSTVYKNLAKKRTSTQEDLQRLMCNEILGIEKAKFIYFMLICEQQTLITKSPSDNKEQSKFLGYEWSNRKGSEGIKYLNVSNSNDEDEDEITETSQALQSISTALYDPNENPNQTKTANPNKLNYWIRQNFIRTMQKAPLSGSLNDSEMSKYAQMVYLRDCIDFKKSDFDLAINLSAQSKIEIVSKYPLVKISEIVTQIESGSRPSGGVGMLDKGALSLGGEHIHNTDGIINLESPKFVNIEYYENNPKGRLQENDILICKDGALTGKIAFLRNELNDKKAMINEHIFILRTQNLTTQKYLFVFLYSTNGQLILKQNITGSAQGGLNKTNLENIKIPLPPLDIQQQIVAECESVDNQIQNFNREIEEKLLSIKKLVQTLQGTPKKLETLCFINKKSIDPTKTPQQEYIYIDIDAVENGTGHFSVDKIIKGENAPSRAKRYADSQSTLVSTVRPNLKGFAFIENEIKNAVYSTGFAILNSKDSNVLLNKLIYILFMYSDDLMEQMINAMPKAAYPSINKTDIEQFVIPVPPIETQQKIIAEFERLQQGIAERQQQIATLKNEYNRILDKYLK